MSTPHELHSATAVRTTPARSWWTAILPFALFSFLLHFVWEMLQVPLYAGMSEAAHWDATRLCLTATIGDVGIGMCAYASAAAVARSWHWDLTRARVAAYLGVGLVITVLAEFLNVYVLHRWSYGPTMPVLWGMSVSPLMQWIIVPLVVLWLTRRHVAGARA